MAVSYVGVTSNNTIAGTTNSLPTSFPAGWATGDLAVLVGHLSGGSLNMTTPAGWTTLPGPSWPTTEGTSSRMYGWYRVLQAGDTAPTISINGAMTGGWEITVFRDAATVAQAATATASGTSLTLPTLAGVLAGSALAAVAHVRVASGTIPTNLSPNAAYTEVVDHATSRATGSANVRMDAAYRLIGSAGSYGGETVGSDVTGSMIAVLVELTATSADATVAPDGLSVPAAVGSPAADATLAIAPPGVSAAVAVGSPSLDGSLSAAPVGVTAPVALGALGASWALSATPDGLAAPVAVGSPAATWAGPAAPDGISASVGVGEPALLGAEVVPDGLVVPVAVGVPPVEWFEAVGPDGLLVPVVVGGAATSAPGQRIARPFSGVVSRPVEVLLRPTGGVVTRP